MESIERLSPHVTHTQTHRLEVECQTPEEAYSTCDRSVAQKFIQYGNTHWTVVDFCLDINQGSDRQLILQFKPSQEEFANPIRLMRYNENTYILSKEDIDEILFKILSRTLFSQEKHRLQEIINLTKVSLQPSSEKLPAMLSAWPLKILESPEFASLFPRWNSKSKISICYDETIFVSSMVERLGGDAVWAVEWAVEWVFDGFDVRTAKVLITRSLDGGQLLSNRQDPSNGLVRSMKIHITQRKQIHVEKNEIQSFVDTIISWPVSKNLHTIKCMPRLSLGCENLVLIEMDTACSFIHWLGMAIEEAIEQLSNSRRQVTFEAFTEARLV